MLYLIESFMRDEQDSPLRCLKIGYAKDVEDRLKAYKTHNPSVKLLKTREGDYELENYLHKYFKRYELPRHQEWFIYSKNIIKEFELIEVQEETITIDEYLEYIRREILRIIPKIYNSLYIKIPELLEELEKEFNINSYGEEIYSEFPKDLCKERIKYVFEFLERKEVEYFSSTDFSDIRMDFPQIMGRQRLAENVFRDECIFIYKLSDATITMDQFNELSLKKVKVSESDLSNFDAVYQRYANGDGIVDLSLMLSDYRLRIKVKKYGEDYTGIDERTGRPKINKLVMISERRAFELRSNVYKSDVQVYNEFADLSIKLSAEDYKEKSLLLNNIRTLGNSKGKFEYKMKNICDLLLNPKWFGKIHISDFHWLPLNYRNYLNYLGPERIRANGYIEAELIREMKYFNCGDELKNMFINEFKLGSRYTLKFLKERINWIYSVLKLSKTAKASDVLEFFNVKEVFIYNSETKKQSKGYEILSLK